MKLKDTRGKSVKAGPKVAPKPKRKPKQGLMGMTEFEKKTYAADRYNKKMQKKAHDKAKKDSFGFSIKRGRKGKIVEQGV